MILILAGPLIIITILYTYNILLLLGVGEEIDSPMHRDSGLCFFFLVYVLELGGMTKNVYHGIFLNYTGFTVYDGVLFFFHA